VQRLHHGHLSQPSARESVANPRTRPARGPRQAGELRRSHGPGCFKHLGPPIVKSRKKAAFRQQTSKPPRNKKPSFVEKEKEEKEKEEKEKEEKEKEEKEKEEKEKEERREKREEKRRRKRYGKGPFF